MEIIVHLALVDSFVLCFNQVNIGEEYPLLQASIEGRWRVDDVN